MERDERKISQLVENFATVSPYYRGVVGSFFWRVLYMVEVVGRGKLKLGVGEH